MSLDAALPKVQQVLQTVPGIVRVYDPTRPPVSIEDFPSFLPMVGTSAPAGGRMAYGPGTRKHDYYLTLRLFLTKQDMGEAVSRLIPFVEATYAAFDVNSKLGGVVTQCWLDEWRFGGVTYGGLDYLAADFVLRISEIRPVTFAAG